MHTTQTPDTKTAQPRLVFFTYKYDDGLPPFLLVHHQEHIRCLAESFDVTVVDYGGDFQHICDTYQPDLALFETGLNILTCKRPEITNIQGRPEIPRLGFINADAWCETRSGTLSEMDRWGIETLFTISVTAADHSPAIADRLFVVPNFIDPELYRDYGETKLIPILLTGATGPQYPWRRAVYPLVSERYPTLICPHAGYLSRSHAAQVMYGERYARTINASFIVPTCGTIAKEVVRKHFEIPGCGSCLITERSQGLEAAGFVDMENCMFADEQEVLDKVSYLFENPDELQRITQAGYQLVHSRHTLKHRDQILQWFRLSRNLGANQHIVQRNPFEPLAVEEKLPTSMTPYVISNGAHFDLIRQGDENLRVGKYREAETLYLKCLNHMNRLPEAKLRLALSTLYAGDAKQANEWIFEPIQYSIDEYKAFDPDPVEWAYYIISLLCLGRLNRAAECSRQFPALHHPELERARWLAFLLEKPDATVPIPACPPGYRRSLHQLPGWYTETWVQQICILLEACGRTQFAESLAKYRGGDFAALQSENAEAEPDGDVKDGAVNKGSWAETLPLKWQRRHALGSLNGRLLSYKVRRKLGQIKSSVLRKVSARFGPSLPFSG